MNEDHCTREYKESCLTTKLNVRSPPTHNKRNKKFRDKLMTMVM